MRIVITAILLLASAVVTAVSVTALPIYDDKTGTILPLVPLTAALWALFALASLALRRVPLRAAVVLVVAGSVAIGGAAILGPPNTSTDSARYSWDGIVQNAGISPYEYVPADPALKSLRPDWLWPAPSVDADGEAFCPGPRVMDVIGSDPLECSTINRAHVPTIYPPMSEIVFAGVTLVTGPDAEYWPMQLLGLILSLAITVLLIVLLTRRGRDPRWAALWGWSPLAATEGVTNSHIDILGGLLVLVATACVASSRRHPGRTWAGGVALGAAIAVKLIPAIAAPALLRRHGWKVAVAAVATFVGLYIPYIVTTGFDLLGYLPGYLTEEGYSSGSRFIMLSLVAPGPAATLLAVVLIALTAALVFWKTNPDDPWLGQLVMIGTVMLIVTPRYPWYALLLVPIIAMTGRWEWLAVPLALTERLLIPSVDLARITVALAILLIVVMSFRRAGPDSPRRLMRWLRHPFSSESAIAKK